MELTRRKFLTTSLIYAAVLALARTTETDAAILKASELIKRIIEGQESPIHLVWIQGQACSGDTVALLNAVEPSLVDVLIGQVQGVPPVELNYHPTVMPQWGVDHLEGPEGPTAKAWDANSIIDQASSGALDPFVLIVEGSIPTEDEPKAAGGYYCSIGERDEHIYYVEDVLKDLASRAAAVVAIGTCAAFGGIPHGAPNPTGARGVYDVLGRDWKSALGLPVINVPGCPAAGDWQVKTLAHLLLTVKGLLPPPELDEEHRPIFLYGETVHETCSRGAYFGLGQFSKNYGEPLCMFALGCKGPIVHCPMNKTGFVEGVGMCTEYGSPCIGCTEPDFPDEPLAPFLKELPTFLLPAEVAVPEAPRTEAPAAGVGLIGLLGGVAAGYYLAKRKERGESEEGGE